MKKLFVILAVSVLILSGCADDDITLDEAIAIAKEDAGFSIDASIVSSDKTDDGYVIILSEGELSKQITLDDDGVLIGLKDLDSTTPDLLGTTDQMMSAESVIDEMQEALDIALADQGLSEDVVYDIHISQEYRHGSLVYDVDFKTSESEYEATVDINGMTIVEKSLERNDDPVTTFDNSISRLEALEAALKANDLDVSDVSGIKIDESHLRGVSVYDIDYEVGYDEYEVMIDATTAEVIFNNIDH